MEGRNVLAFLINLMALTVTEKWSQPDSAVTSDERGQFTSEATRVFEITTTSNTYTPVTVRYEAMAEGYIPRPKSIHPSDAYLTCRSVSCQQIAPFFYVATARYTKAAGDDQDPNIQPAQIDFDHIITEEAIDQDADSKPIATVLGESFDPPLTRPVADLFIRVSKNVLTYDPTLASLFIHKVNSDPFLGFPAGTLLIEQFSASSVITENAEYWRRTIGIHVRRGAPNTTDRKAWYRRVRAEGFYVAEKVEPFTGPLPGGRLKVRALDAEDQPVTKPVLHKVADGIEITDPTKAEWYEFRVFQETEFSPLNFL